MTALSLNKVVKRYADLQVIHGIDLKIEPKEFVVFVGPSGCGKSTLLRMIAGLEEISDGDLTIGSERMNDTAPAQRGIAMVFQSYALYPHMSVYKNLAFGLETAGVSKAEIDVRVQKTAAILQIDQYLQRKPKALSGGQRQRVAIGRAIIREPKIFLFDEPLSNLDAELRVQMRVEIAKLHRDLGVTSIYVTHDQVEAMTMADKIVVLRAGRIEQVGSPLDLYNRPVNKFVAGFIGSPKMNFLKVTGQQETGTGTAVTVASTQIPLPPVRGTADSLGVRPEHLSLTDGVPLGPMTIQIVEQLGGSTLLYGALTDGQTITVQLDGQQSPQRGSQVSLFADPATCHLFDKDGLALR